MPDLFRKKKEVYLVSKRVNDSQTIVGVAPTFRAAYKVGCFNLAISKPNFNERQARRKRNKDKEVWIFDYLKYQGFEEAFFSPIGEILKIEKIPVLRA